MLRNLNILYVTIAAALVAAGCATPEPKAASQPGGNSAAIGEDVRWDHSEGPSELTLEEAHATAMAQAETLSAEADLGGATQPGGDAGTAEAVPDVARTTTDEEYLRSVLEAERRAEEEDVQQRVFYPDELFGAAMVRTSRLAPGMVVFYYPMRGSGGVTVNIEKQDIKVTGVDQKTVDNLMNALKGSYLDEGEKVEHYQNLDMLEITAKEENIPFILDALDFLDSPKQQITIEAAVWEIFEATDRQLGTEVTIAKREGSRTFFGLFNSAFKTQAFLDSLTSDRPYQGGTFEFASTADSSGAHMNMVFQFLESRGYADVVSQPRMTVSVGETARIITGEEIPFQTVKLISTRRDIQVEYKTVGVQLYVTPIRAGQDMVTVAILPIVSDVIGYSDAGETGVSNPIIATREAATKVTVSNGELIRIGGLEQTRKTITEHKVPILGDIPLIKYLFRSERETTRKVQLWFTVRPTIAGETERLIVPELTGPVAN